jgi:Na+-transporting NADH:ubiquinone oxidoreductase subunit C
MKHFSNRYIYLFSAGLVIVVAIVLSMAATLLKPIQEKNLEVEKKRSILESINIPADRTNAEELFSKYIIDSYVIDYKANRRDGVEAFGVVMKVEQKKPLDQQSLPLYFASADDGSGLVILPLEGKGLWGPIWGYVSLKEDMNTIYGIMFDHKGETPGLGAEINQTPFEGQFIGQKLFQDGKFVSVKVQKSNEQPVENHSVDAISGGTITSKGLEQMLFDCIVKYEEYFKKNIK